MHFKILNVLEILQDSNSAYRDLTIKSTLLENIFAFLLIHNITHSCMKRPRKTD